MTPTTGKISIASAHSTFVRVVQSRREHVEDDERPDEQPEDYDECQHWGGGGGGMLRVSFGMGAEGKVAYHPTVCVTAVRQERNRRTRTSRCGVRNEARTAARQGGGPRDHAARRRHRDRHRVDRDHRDRRRPRDGHRTRYLSVRRIGALVGRADGHDRRVRRQRSDKQRRTGRRRARDAPGIGFDLRSSPRRSRAPSWRTHGVWIRRPRMPRPRWWRSSVSSAAGSNASKPRSAVPRRRSRGTWTLAPHRTGWPAHSSGALRVETLASTSQSREASCSSACVAATTPETPLRHSLPRGLHELPFRERPPSRVE